MPSAPSHRAAQPPQRKLSRATSAPSARRGGTTPSPFHAPSAAFHATSRTAPRVVAPINATAAAQQERVRQGARLLEAAIAASFTRARRSPSKLSNLGGLTARMTEGHTNARECSDWAKQLEVAVHEGIELGLADELLTAAVQRILELEVEAAEQAASSKQAAESRAALAAVPIRTPRDVKEWKVFATPRDGRSTHRTGASKGGRDGRTPRELADERSAMGVLREGSLVQLQGLEGACGLTYHGYYDASLGEYNGRKGRVSRDPPAWVIKAQPAAPAAAEAGGGGPAAKADVAAAPPAAALVPVLLDSRSTDRDRGSGVWVAVPPQNLKVL